MECKGVTAKKLLTFPGITVHQQGNTDWTLLFDLALADQVFAIVKPRKRRKLSEEQKAANAERLKDHRFKNGTQPYRHQDPKDQQFSTWSKPKVCRVICPLPSLSCRLGLNGRADKAK